MEIVLTINGQRIESNSDFIIVDKTKNFIKFVFNFSEEWDDFNITAQFRQGEHVCNVDLDENRCAILPEEISYGICHLVIYGTKDEIAGVTDEYEFRIEQCKFVFEDEADGENP